MDGWRYMPCLVLFSRVLRIPGLWLRQLYTKAGLGILGCVASKIIFTMTPTPIYAPIGIFFYLFCFSWYSESFILKCSALFFICNNLPSHLPFCHPWRVDQCHGSIQHGVPMVEIPFFADQPENLIWVETRKFGVSLQLKQIKVETLALKMKEVMEESGVQLSGLVVTQVE